MNIKLTNRFPNDVPQKNNIDEQYRMQITPEMQQMFSNPEDSADGSSQFTYQNISIREVKTRTITEEEYQKLPSRTKSILFHLPYFGIFVFGLLTITMIICLFNNLDVLSTQDIFFMIFGIVVFTFVIVWAVRDGLASRITQNSQIADGMIIFLNREYSKNSQHNTPSFRASVALHDQKAFVKRARCSKHDYYKMEVNSKVYLLIKGGKAFAIPVE